MKCNKLPSDLIAELAKYEIYIKNDNEKARVAMCEIYPESAPVDWLLRLRHWHIPCSISPLHDKDIYDSDKFSPLYDESGQILIDENGEPKLELKHKKGDIKKSHYHVMIAYGNATTFKTFAKIINDIGGVVPPWEHAEVCNVPSMYRYFAHLDDPDKYQYNPSDIINLGGFNPLSYANWLEKMAPLDQIIDIIQNNRQITSYSKLITYLKYEQKDMNLFYVAMHNTMALRPFISDLRQHK